MRGERGAMTFLVFVAAVFLAHLLLLDAIVFYVIAKAGSALNGFGS